MYNKYELLWLWYDYHCEKADHLICSGTSVYDPDMKIPVNFHQQKLSDENAKNNRKIIESIASEQLQELYKHKKTFYHLKNIGIFKEYEILDEQGKFDFIHEYVKLMLEKQHKKKELDTKEILFYDKF